MVPSTAVGSFTMLHHVATTALQQRVLAEAFRVLAPGGPSLGSDSLASHGYSHEFHEGDTYNPMEPAVLLVRLQAVGFTEVTASWSTTSCGGSPAKRTRTNQPSPTANRRRRTAMTFPYEEPLQRSHLGARA